MNNIKQNNDGTISPIDPSKPSDYSTAPQSLDDKLRKLLEDSESGIKHCCGQTGTDDIEADITAIKAVFAERDVRKRWKGPDSIHSTGPDTKPPEISYDAPPEQRYGEPSGSEAS